MSDPEAHGRSFLPQSYRSLLWAQESSRRDEIFSFASKRLPELGHCIKDNFSSIPQDEVFRRGIAARHRLKHIAPIT